MAYNMLAFNDPRMWGVGQDYNFGEALYANWQRQLNEVMGFEDQLQKWNAQRDKDQLQQMADQSGLASTLSNNNANILGVSDAMVGRAQALAQQRAQAVGSTPIPPEQRRLWERLGLVDDGFSTDPYMGY